MALGTAPGGSDAQTSTVRPIRCAPAKASGRRAEVIDEGRRRSLRPCRGDRIRRPPPLLARCRRRSPLRPRAGRCCQQAVCAVTPSSGFIHLRRRSRSRPEALPAKSSRGSSIRVVMSDRERLAADRRRGSRSNSPASRSRCCSRNARARAAHTVPFSASIAT